MKLQTSPATMICTGLCVFCAGVTGIAQVSQNLQSDRAEGGRVKALRTITQHAIAGSCKKVKGGTSFTVGDEVVLDGSGRSPTACFVNRKKEFGFAGYLDGKLQILYVFTPKEVEAKHSELTQEKQQ